jgi:hypothetical protein
MEGIMVFARQLSLSGRPVNGSYPDSCFFLSSMVRELKREALSDGWQKYDGG